jgi:CRP/FNR family transcriptional regulator
MKTTNDLIVQNKCITCQISSKTFFCNLPESDLKAFESFKITNTYLKGDILFTEGQPAEGVYMICQGAVKISTCSREGKVIILRVAEAGELLGLHAVVSDSDYETTAEVINPCQINFVEKTDFLKFIRQSTHVGLSVVKQSCREYHKAFVQVRSLGLSQTADDKLVKLLLEWCKKTQNGSNGSSGSNGSNGSSGSNGSNGSSGSNGSNGSNGSVKLKISYTHGEIAEMIGTSRETVTRLLNKFRNRKLIEHKEGNLIICDPKKLKRSIGLKTKKHL